jgi:hypothetical protein
MATGDVTITVQVEGGTAKTATIPTATRVQAMAWLNRNRGSAEDPNLTNATWSVHMANNAANSVIHAAEKQLISAAAPSTPTFTAAS